MPSSEFESHRLWDNGAASVPFSLHQLLCTILAAPSLRFLCIATRAISDPDAVAEIGKSQIGFSLLL